MHAGGIYVNAENLYRTASVQHMEMRHNNARKIDAAIILPRHIIAKICLPIKRFRFSNATSKQSFAKKIHADKIIIFFFVVKW
jgi:hypothetical protein